MVLKEIKLAPGSVLLIAMYMLCTFRQALVDPNFKTSTKQACLGAILERVQTIFLDLCEPVWYSTCLWALTLMYWGISDGNPGHMSYINYILNYTLSFLYLSSSSSGNEQHPRCFRPWTLSLNIGLNLFPSDSFVMFTSPASIFYRGAPGFATDCPCGVRCRGLTTCLLYVGPLFGNLVLNDSRFVSLT